MAKKNRQHKRRFDWRQDYNVGVTLCNKVSIRQSPGEHNSVRAVQIILDGSGPAPFIHLQIILMDLHDAQTEALRTLGIAVTSTGLLSRGKRIWPRFRLAGR